MGTVAKLAEIPLRTSEAIPSGSLTRDNFEENFSDWSSALRMWSKTTLKSVAVPGGVLLLSAAVLVYSGWLTLALPALSFLYYCALLGGMLLAWRFHSSRTFFALLVLFLAQEAIVVFGGGYVSQGTPGWAAIQAVAVLVPLDFVLIALMQERGFAVSATAPVGLMLFVQFVIVAVLCRAAEASLPSPAHPRHLASALALPGYALLLFIAATTFLLARFLFTHKPVDNALLWSLAAFLLSLRAGGTKRN
jgi:hypothetical protein